MAPPRSKATSSSVPLPPLELADRVGAVSGSARSLEPFLVHGRAGRELIEQMLPGDWTWKDKRVLDFGCGAARILRHFLPEATEGQFVGCDIDAPSIGWLQENLCPPLEAFVNDEAPPFDQPDGAFDLVYAISVFTHITDEWAAWLLELHRVLRDGGLLLASTLGGAMSEAIAGEPWDAARVGMNVLDRAKGWELGGPNVLISEWWLRAHWGRAFDVVRFESATAPGAQDLVLLRRRAGLFSREELERPEPGEPRELDALRHNVCQLHRESALMREREAWALGAQARERTVREHVERERDHERAVRESLRIQRDAMATSRSWRVTRPLRELKRLGRPDRWRT